jgi:hypothetical protein
MKEQRSAYKSYIEKIILNLLLNYPDQNISNQFKPKKLLYIKSLGTDKTGVTPMRSDGQITVDTKQKSNIPNSVSPYSPWNHKTASPIAPQPTP